MIKQAMISGVNQDVKRRPKEAASKYIQPVFQPTAGACPRTNTIRTKPQVTRIAPIQSTRASISGDTLSGWNEKNPPTAHNAERPAER